jgi:hypothetical protein
LITANRQLTDSPHSAELYEGWQADNNQYPEYSIRYPVSKIINYFYKNNKNIPPQTS